MTLITRALIILAGTVALGAMMLTNPDYNRALRPFTAHAAAGEWAHTRLFAGTMDGWRTADRISYTAFGSKVTRDSDGVFLIVDVSLSGTSVSTKLSASWKGSSGREYYTTARIRDVPGQLEDLWLQPELNSRAIAIFELPKDEVVGGAMRISLRLDPDLDGTLMLDPPAGTPPHEAVTRFDG